MLRSAGSGAVAPARESCSSCFSCIVQTEPLPVPIVAGRALVMPTIFSAPVGESLFVPFEPRVVCSGEGVAYRVVMVRQRFFSQACLRSPGPPNLGLSRQFWHAPQSLRVQGTHWPHRCSVPRFLPDSVALDMALAAAAALLPLGA